MKPEIKTNNRGTYWIEFNGNVIRGGMYSLLEAKGCLNSYLAVYEQAFFDGQIYQLNKTNKLLNDLKEKYNV